ncbi:phosphotransferase enzyme family protein [Paenibacillus sp. HJGM_3]|uniref:phosphotransferase enzyme family protein n=1 Tax=Paenibacillus sp. HJGM_3 TaxID=3379816 RepID=UPI0038593100
MTDEAVHGVLSQYGMHQSRIEFLRHNENRTYKVTDPDQGSSYLLRIHQPVTGNFRGVQHTDQGLWNELELLEAITAQTNLSFQSPVRNDRQALITDMEYEGKIVHCSLLTWIEGRQLLKEDVSNDRTVVRLGALTAELHKFFRTYDRVSPEHRPSHGTERHIQMLQQIQNGVELGLILPSDYRLMEETIRLINSRLEGKGKRQDNWGLVHGDLNMGNLIVSGDGELSFIDFSLFGYGYFSLDVSMGALMVPAELRSRFLEGYYGTSEVPAVDCDTLEGFMLVAILGYYAFHMKNEAVHPWIRERAPILCARQCRPFLSGQRILDNL